MCHWVEISLWKDACVLAGNVVSLTASPVQSRVTRDESCSPTISGGLDVISLLKKMSVHPI